MEHNQTSELNNDFRTCLFHLLEFGMAANPRGTVTKELLNYNISLHDPRNRIVNFSDRKTNTKYLLGEFIWYLSGSNDPAGILPYAKFWDSIRNAGTETAYPKGTVNSNYGNRLFGHAEPLAFKDMDNGAGGTWKLNQWDKTITMLTKDKDSRQAIMNIHVPTDRHEGNKDVPCTLTLHWFIRENKLHLIVNMRSNDVILGFTNDVFQFTMLQECMMVQLRETYPDLELGQYYHNAGSMHIYEKNFPMAEKIIADEQALELPMVPMDRFDENIQLGLYGSEMLWRGAGMPSSFDFDNTDPFKLLTPYWQNLVKFCFTEDHMAMHEVFGVPHHDDE